MAASRSHWRRRHRDSFEGRSAAVWSDGENNAARQRTQTELQGELPDALARLAEPFGHIHKLKAIACTRSVG